MSGPGVMTVYDGQKPLGEIRDFGPGKVMAYNLTESGRLALGFFPTRREAIKALNERHPSSTGQRLLSIIALPGSEIALPAALPGRVRSDPDTAVLDQPQRQLTGEDLPYPFVAGKSAMTQAV